jgi:hypothetical protein
MTVDGRQPVADRIPKYGASDTWDSSGTTLMYILISASIPEIQSLDNGVGRAVGS